MNVDEALTIVNIVLGIANAVMIAINLLLVNRRAKEGLKLSQREQRIGILRESGVSIDLLAKRNTEEIKVTNIGGMTIEKLGLDICIQRESGEDLLKKKYVINTSLFKSQDLVIPLNEVLRKILGEKKLLTYIEQEDGTDFDPDIGEDVPIIFSKWDAGKDFALIVTIKTGYEVLGEEKTQQDNFRMSYVIDPSFYQDDMQFIDSDNFEIRIQKISGEWQ